MFNFHRMVIQCSDILLVNQQFIKDLFEVNTSEYQFTVTENQTQGPWLEVYSYHLAVYDYRLQGNRFQQMVLSMCHHADLS